MCSSPLEVQDRGLEICEQTLGNVKGKKRTEREWRWHDTGSTMGRGRRGDGNDYFLGRFLGDLAT